jgi:hypothetical protein
MSDKFNFLVSYADKAEVGFPSADEMFENKDHQMFDQFAMKNHSNVTIPQIEERVSILKV